MPIWHCGGSDILRGLVGRFYKFVIARCEAPKKCLRHNIITRFRITMRHCEELATKQSPRLKRILLDCFAYARNDGSCHSEGAARRISFNKRSFTFVQLCIQAYTSSLRCGGSLCKDDKVYNNDEKKRFFGFHPQNDKKKAAFTLAEVLITLGIIGIVAAMTLPILIANYQKKVVETRLISFYSKINQAYRMSYAENGDTLDWVVSDKTYSYDEMLAWLEKYLFPYMRYVYAKKYVSSVSGETFVHVGMVDGSSVYFQIDGNGQDVIFYPKGKFERGPRTKFVFQFSKRKYDGSTTKNSINFVEPYVFNWDGRRESLFTNGTWGCKKGCIYCGYCTKLIQLNGWEIPDDYPW